MKTIYQLLIVSALGVTSFAFASAQYYYPNQYQNQYQNYQNYTTYNTASTVGGCSIINGNPTVYYGNCVGVAPTNTYQNSYYTNQQYTYTYPQQNYYQTYPTNTYHGNTSPYQTYGYSHGTWYPGYSTDNISNLFNSVIQTVNQNTNCYYQNGYQICY